MAELIMDSAERNKNKRSGRPIAIDDPTLVGRRDQLVFLFETTWEHVGLRLPWIKKPADLLEILKVWKNDNRENQYYVVQLLLRPSSVTATPTDLTRLRRQLGEANIAVRNAWDFQDTCRKALDIAKRAFSDHLTETDKAKVEDQISRRTENLAQAEADYRAANDGQNTAQQTLNEAESSFARAEFTRFVRSNRYRLTPLNIANALAGLPYIGWRQSALRCKKHPPVGSNGLSMQIFNVIRRIADSCTRRSDLIGHAQRWLKDKKNRKSLGAEELRKKFYYLRWAIKAVLEAEKRVTARELPFAITREYWRRVNRSSNVDLLFEEEERIAD
jgi:hypothetical protein